MKRKITRSRRLKLEATLIVAARHLLETEGLEATGLRATARAVGVSHMAPYRHFENKDALLAAVAEQGFWELSAAMAKVKRGLGVRNRIGVAYVSFALDNPALFRLMFSPHFAARENFPELATASQAAFNQCLIAAGVPEAHLSKKAKAPPKEAIALWSIVHGLANLVLDGLVPLPTKPLQRSTAINQILQTTRLATRS